MGSSKYPEEDKFSKSVSLNNGYTNAMTGNELTAYYFTSTHSGFPTVLDIWSQFFKSPLLKEDSLNREAEAVNSEYVNSLSNEEFRTSYIIKLMMNPSNPSAWFNVGSLDSLLRSPARFGIKISSEVRKFYEKYYVTQNMKAMLVGNFSIEELQNLAVDAFGQVKNINTERPDTFSNQKKIDSEG